MRSVPYSSMPAASEGRARARVNFLAGVIAVLFFALLTISGGSSFAGVLIMILISLLFIITMMKFFGY